MVKLRWENARIKQPIVETTTAEELQEQEVTLVTFHTIFIKIKIKLFKM